MQTLHTLNLPALREEAAQRLRRNGTRPFTDMEAAVVGEALGRRLNRDLEHPLLQSAAFEIDTLGIGTAEWVLGWLSPSHAAATIPETTGAIALHLLGYLPPPTSVRARFRQEPQG